MPDFSGRNFEERGFTIGIGGYAGPYRSLALETALLPSDRWDPGRPRSRSRFVAIFGQSTISRP
jgi:hypothetical protein